MKFSWILFAAYLLTAALASDADEDKHGGDTGLDDAVKIANTTLPDGTEVNFFEREDGMILLVAKGEASDEEDGNKLRFLGGDGDDDDDDDDDDLSPSEMYEKLTGKQAPEALVDAEERAKGPHENADEAIVGDDEDDEVDVENDDDGDGRRYLRNLGSSCYRSTFKNRYCKYGGLCYTCWTSSSKKTVKLSGFKKVKSTAHAYKGSLVHKIRYLTKGGSYRTVVSDYVGTGYVSLIEGWYPSDIYWKAELDAGYRPGWNWNVWYN